MSVSHLAALRSRAVRDHTPLSVSIELTARCNYRCQQCYIPWPVPPDLLTTKRLLDLLEELAAAGTLYLALTGGEPLLRPDWLEIAERARHLGFHVTLLSNGSLITPQIADSVATLNVTVEVTVPSVTRAVFESVSLTEGSFVRTMRGIKLLTASGATVRIKVPVTRLDPCSFVGVFRFGARIGVPTRADVRILPRRDGNLAPLALRVDEMDMLAFYRSSGAFLPGDCRTDCSSPACDAGESSAHISSSGLLMACPALPGGDANICETPFLQAWRCSRWLAEVRAARPRPQSAPHCRSSSYFGHCHAQALLEHGSLNALTSWARRHGEVLDELARGTASTRDEPTP